MNDSKAKVWFSGTVSLGGSFTIDATAEGENKLKANTVLHIFEAGTSNVLQEIEFHTSCSQPLEVGNQFGSALLTEFIPEP